MSDHPKWQLSQDASPFLSMFTPLFSSPFPPMDTPGLELINTGEIDPMGRVLRNPAAKRLEPITTGATRLNPDRLAAVEDLVDLCNRRLQDLLNEKSIFPLPLLTNLEEGKTRIILRAGIGIHDLIIQ
eukprot:TRINITY_DN15365_c0_g1_i1.p1 TRINITY_DN15365_c0_g1~~TRINITY_DN15365_c0_g1_i1.p1  ORF type:complete len:128 (-),score=22.28 TRINITY_DN15365_c0_g1_i1:110-493(-)